MSHLGTINEIDPIDPDEEANNEREAEGDAERTPTGILGAVQGLMRPFVSDPSVRHEGDPEIDEVRRENDAEERKS